MAELSLKQIVDKLNTEFTGEHRKLVFWYDEKGDIECTDDEIQKKYKYQIREDREENLPTVPPELASSFQLIPYVSAEDAVFKALGVE